MEKLLEIPIDLAQACVKCGLCKSVCPTYPRKLQEGGFARGRLFLAEKVLKGEIPLKEEVAKQWEECALCRRCEWICPNDVKFKEILVYAKGEKVKKLGGGLLQTLSLLSLQILQSVPFKRISSLLWRFIPSFKLFLPNGFRIKIPRPSSKPFSLRGKTFKAKREKATLLFFTGCMIDFFYGKTGEAVVELLNRAGYSVVVPENIKCCGAPFLYSGELEKFERIKEENLKEMKRYSFDKVVVACPTCGGALLEDYGMDWEVLDFTQLLKDLPLKGKGRVTFHVPCHSYSAMKVGKDFYYEFLKNLKGCSFKEAKRGQSCCGFAGLFSVKNPKMSEDILKEKVKDFKETGAEFILTTCPGCVLQLSKGVKGQRVMHLAEYLLEANS